MRPQNASYLNILVSRHSAATYFRCGHYFVGNLTGFAVVKEFWKLIRILRNYHHERVPCLFS